uniref:Dynein light intermediate chain n=1 Tax=Gadus morhua TaxID=8049 RepID=A0A8C5B1D7_GADMO
MSFGHNTVIYFISCIYIYHCFERSEILSDVSTRSSSKLPSGKNILVFGEDGSGKTSLMSKLQGGDYNKKGRGLEYLYLNIHDEDRDDPTRCNVWILDGDLYHKGLLKFAVTAQTLANSLALFVVDMSRPWSIMESLQKWASVLRDHVDKLKISPEHMRELEQKMMKAFQDYAEPEDVNQASSQRRAQPGSDGEDVVLPLGENTLTHNLGIPVLIVCSKCDAVAVLEKEHDYREEHFDFLQSHIRRFCLNYGAGLIYTSVKEEKNLDLLHKYILHKIYEFQFSSPALVVEKDAVFIPAGWDNEKKIGILHENFSTVRPEDPFEGFIIKPPVRKLVHDKEINAEDEQVFLMKQQVGSPAHLFVNDPSCSPPQHGKHYFHPSHVLNEAAICTGNISFFLKSLLAKQPATPTRGANVNATGGYSLVSLLSFQGQKPGLTDVQAELDRMTRKPETVVTVNNVPPPTENQA